MKFLPSKFAAALIASTAFAVTSCTGGGPNVPALYPTATPAATTTPVATSTPTASATSTPTSAATGTATTNPTSAPTGAATGTPTSAPTGTATTAPTATPSATSTMVAANCPPPMPYPSPATTTYPFQAQSETINLPTYQDITGTSTIPNVTSGLPATVTIKLSRTNFDNVSAPSGSGTPELYSSLILNQQSGAGVTYDSNMVPVSLTSPCSIAAGHTYGLYVMAGGVQTQATSNLMPSGSGSHTVNTALQIPALYCSGANGGPPCTFPANTLVDIISTQQS